MPVDALPIPHAVQTPELRRLAVRRRGAAAGRDITVVWGPATTRSLRIVSAAVRTLSFSVED